MRLCVPALLLCAVLGHAEDRATITGKISDSSGKPVEHATVMVYEAGVKKGYSTFCPTCWVDCGKRAITAADGSYTIPGVSNDLWFTLLVMRDGFASQYIQKVDPSNGPAADPVLKLRKPVEDTSQVVRGLVVDAQGKPVRDAVVEQQGVSTNGPRGLSTMFGGSDGWIDALAVSNEKGEFEIAYGKPAVQMILQVQPRGMASKLFTEPTGPERKTMTVTDGAVIRGRLVQNGKPVANAQLGLATHLRDSGSIYKEAQIGTREDGTFAITNVPAGRIFLIYPKMDSLAARNLGAHPVPVETKDDGQEVDIGDIELQPTYSLKGKVVLSDGKPLPSGTHLTISADQAWDSQIVTVDDDGTFEVHGLPSGVFEISAGVRGYALAQGRVVEALVNRDVTGFTVRLVPAPRRQ